MVFLNILWCAIVNRQTRINKCRAMAPNLGWFQWKAHKYAFQLIMGFHDGKHATMNYVDYKQHATKYIGFLLILARSHSRWVLLVLSSAASPTVCPVYVTTRA